MVSSNISKSLSNKAFSLIEISIVILVIVILIAGTIQGSKAINKSKLTAANTLTQSSPVAGMKNLVTWWESTSEKSFLASEAKDSASITTWYNINPQLIKKYDAAQLVSNNKPIYKVDTINNLPSIYFNGSNSYFEIPYDKELNPSTMTIFAVVKIINKPSIYGAIISSRDDFPSRGYIFYASQDTPPLYQVWSGNATSGGWQPIGSSTIMLGNPEILSFTKSSDTINIYKNGENVDSSYQTISVNDTNPLRIGAGRNESTAHYFFDGYIGELILFDKSLKDSERKSIEKYLSQKWHITITP